MMAKPAITIKPADLNAQELKTLLMSHLDAMLSLSPEESVHALNLEQINNARLSLYSLYLDDQLAGCGGLYRIDSSHAEIKSMKTADDFLRQGVAKAMLSFLLEKAKGEGYDRVSLETGTERAFIPAHQLYENAGFKQCSAFSNYQEDPNSRFYSLTLA